MSVELSFEDLMETRKIIRILDKKILDRSKMLNMNRSPQAILNDKIIKAQNQLDEYYKIQRLTTLLKYGYLSSYEMVYLRKLERKFYKLTSVPYT